jgi:hypothetical protein
MESTGQHWRAVWNVLEDHFERLILVNPQHIKGLLGGHKQLCQAGNIKISGGHGSVWDFGEDDAQGAGGG